ncbi:MAG: hypothetical protein ACTSX9_01815 [Candidatus Njordarchaeales archaeon]
MSISSLKDYEKILQIFVETLKELKSPMERRLLTLNIAEHVPEIKWWGISVLADRIFEDLLKEKQDAITLAIAAKIIVKEYPEKSLMYARRVLSELENLSEWEYDRALSLIYVALALEQLNEHEMAFSALRDALKWARKIPDRSDRSIILSKLIPMIYRSGQRSLALTLIDEVVYTPKKVDAVLGIIRHLTISDENILEHLLRKIPSDEQPIALATWADTISPSNPSKVLEICNRALGELEERGEKESLRAATVYLRCFSALIRIKNNPLISNKALEIYSSLRNTLIKKIEERPYLNLFLELIEILTREKYIERVREILSRLKILAKRKTPPDNLFILNKIAYIYAKINDFSQAAENLTKVLGISRTLEKLLAVPAMIDSAITATAIMNEFPATIPRELVLEYADMIRPAEYFELKIHLSRENFEFLKTLYPGQTLSEAINSIILKGRILESMRLDENIKKLVQKLVDLGEYTILHYLLKYIYSVGIPESERQTLLNLLGRTVEMLTLNQIDEAKSYIELILSRLERNGIPLIPILYQYFSEYVIALLLR